MDVDENSEMSLATGGDSEVEENVVVEMGHSSVVLSEIQELNDRNTESEPRMTVESEDESESDDDESATEYDSDSGSEDSDDATPARSPTVSPPQTWNWSQSDNFQPTVLTFDETRCGFTFPLPRNRRLSPLELLKLTFPQEAFELVVHETNRYADECISNATITTRRMRTWTPISKDELLRFLAVQILMGINVKPQQNHYWKKDPLFAMPIFSKIMSSDRYFEIQKHLHFNNNQNQIPGDRLFKISELWSMWNIAWQSLLVPYKNLSVDESITAFRGRLFCKQYCPMKRDRFGLKSFSIVDNNTGMIIYSIIYSGKGHVFTYPCADVGYGGSIVMELMGPYLNKGHHIYCDNYFSSPNLAHQLLMKNTHLTATARKNRKHMPKLQRRMKKGEVEVFHDHGIMVEMWRDKRVVTMISTAHTHEMMPVENRNPAIVAHKPASVISYNQNARGIDQADMMESFYTTLRKSMKWTKKLFFAGFERCLINAFRIHVKLYGRTPYLDFRLSLVREIFQTSTQSSVLRSHPNDPLRLQGKHFMVYNVETQNQKHSSRKYAVCASRKIVSKTKFHCKTCEVPLCAVPCFELYHTRRNY